ncbi:MAG: protease modulator HflC [Alphaproteobacteria bacterium]
MNRNRSAFFGFVLALAILGAFNALFIVRQTEQAIVIQFGDPKRVIREPGLQVKIPFIQNVVFYDKRVIDLDPPVEQVIMTDQKRLDVNTYTRFRIADPLRFFQAVAEESRARSRLSDIVTSGLRRALGNVTLQSLLSADREAVMAQIRQQADIEASALGIRVVDVRIRRANLPEETSQAIYARMQSEREREAREFRAQGQEVAQEIRSRADRERVVIVAEAQKKAQTLRGEGDAEAIRIYADSFSRDPEFYSFYRSLQAYRHALGDGATTFVLSPTSEFFRYFERTPGASRGGTMP